MKINQKTEEILTLSKDLRVIKIFSLDVKDKEPPGIDEEGNEALKAVRAMAAKNF